MYIKTTSEYNAAPRFDHDPTTGESLGLLIEESRTNRILLSIPPATSSTGWSVVNATGTANAISAPDGTLSGTEYSITNSDPSTKRIFSWPIQNQPIINRTVSVFAKAGTANELYMTGINADGTIVINLNTGVVTTNTSGSTVTTEEYLNGWWRIVLTRNSGNALLYTALPSGQSGTFYLWGGQVEEGSFPTSYIPTTGTALTRLADVVSITGSNFSSWYNQSEGSVFCDGASISNQNSSYWSIGQTTTANGATVLVYPQNTITFQVVDSTFQVNRTVFSGTVTDRKKTAVGLKQTNFASVINGGSVILDSSGSLPGNLNILRIGNYLDGGTVFDYSGTISRLTYFPYRLPDATLQAITS